jgi:hypothetical protein
MTWRGPLLALLLLVLCSPGVPGGTIWTDWIPKPSEWTYSSRNIPCNGECEQHGEAYYWCSLMDDWGHFPPYGATWDYCSLDRRMTSYGKECADDCLKRGEDYGWCNKVEGGWDYCSRKNLQDRSLPCLF